MKHILIAAFVALSFAPALALDHAVTVTGYAPLGTGGFQLLTVKVAYGDLDLAGTQGATTLLDRINQAARLACGERMYWSRNIDHNKAFTTCRSQAVAKAVKAVGAPTLTQVAAAQ